MPPSTHGEHWTNTPTYTLVLSVAPIVSPLVKPLTTIFQPKLDQATVIHPYAFLQCPLSAHGVRASHLRDRSDFLSCSLPQGQKDEHLVGRPSHHWQDTGPSEKLFPPIYSLLKRAGLGSTANGGTHSKRY